MRFYLQAGLMLRFGANTYELVRELEGDEFQFEDVRTRRAKVMKKDEIVQGVYAKAFEVVLAEAPSVTEGVKTDVTSIVDISSLTDRERAKLTSRFDYVKALQRAKVSRGQRNKIALVVAGHAKQSGDTKPPSTSAVMKWARDYQTSGSNVIALVDRYRSAKRPKRIPKSMEEVVWRVLKRSYFTRDKYSGQHAYEQLTIEAEKLVKSGEVAVNDAAISYPTFMRRIHEVDLYHRIASREGTARARMECRTAFPDGYATRPLERVEIDHTPLNYVVMCDRTGLPLGRPTLTVMLDAFSSYILGFYLSFHGPGLTSVSGVVRSALQPKDHIVSAANLSNPWLCHGMGDEWVLDNGMEFHSFGYKQMAMALGVDVMYCRVRTPWLKPHVERFFSTLNNLTLQKGRVSKKVANVLSIDPYKDAAITFSDLVLGLLQFVVDVYPFEPNMRKMARPFDLFKEGLERCPPAVYPGTLEDLRMASAMSRYLTFSQGGIELLGLPYGSYGFKGLANRHGTGIKVLCKWDPDDISQLYVQDPTKSGWITAQCRWTDYAMGLSENQHKLIRKFAREEMQNPDAHSRLLKSKVRLHDHWMNSTRPRTRADSLAAGRYVDFTSSRLVEPTLQKNSTPSDFNDEPRLEIEPTKAPVINDVPDFDSFTF